MKPLCAWTIQDLILINLGPSGTVQIAQPRPPPLMHQIESHIEISSTCQGLADSRSATVRFKQRLWQTVIEVASEPLLDAYSHAAFRRHAKPSNPFDRLVFIYAGC